MHCAIYIYIYIYIYIFFYYYFFFQHSSAEQLQSVGIFNWLLLPGVQFSYYYNVIQPSIYWKVAVKYFCTYVLIVVN